MPRLSEIARHVVQPSGIVSTGWPAVQAKCLDLGVRFRPWQPGVGRLILAKRADGKYAATIGGTGLSIPRQVGKTFLVAAIVFALCLLRPGLTVIWTAHRLRTAEETFGKLQVFAKRRKIAAHIAKVVLGSGEEEIRFRNGSRIMFGARERGFGRGFDEVDVLIFDEAQILGDGALDDMIPATNQSRQDTGALLLFMGTPPKPEDKSEVFTRMRSEALSGEDEDTGWVEFGADTDYRPTPLPADLTPADWKQVAKGNPSYPQDTPREAILRMRKKLGPESYLREGLGIWDADRSQYLMPNWDRWKDPKSAPVSSLVFAIETTFDRAFTAIGVAGLRVDGLPHIELIEHRPGTAWVAERVKALQDKWQPMVTLLDGHSSAASLIPDLGEAGVRLDVTNAPEYAQACGRFFDAVDNGQLRHLGQDRLTQAVQLAAQRPLGGAWAWDRRIPGADISPLVAVTLALWGSVTKEPEPTYASSFSV